MRRRAFHFRWSAGDGALIVVGVRFKLALQREKLGLETLDLSEFAIRKFKSVDLKLLDGFGLESALVLVAGNLVLDHEVEVFTGADGDRKLIDLFFAGGPFFADFLVRRNKLHEGQRRGRVAQLGASLFVSQKSLVDVASLGRQMPDVIKRLLGTRDRGVAELRNLPGE